MTNPNIRNEFGWHVYNKDVYNGPYLLKLHTAWLNACFEDNLNPHNPENSFSPDNQYAEFYRKLLN